MPLLRDRLAGLAANLLIFIADALALVGLRLPERPHLGCELADELLVDPLDRDVRLVGTGDREARGNLDLQFVETPSTMLAVSARVRPCTERAIRASPSRITLMAPADASTSIDTAGWRLCSSLPSGPSTASVRPETDAFTPFGIETGALPIRDIACLTFRTTRVHRELRRRASFAGPLDHSPRHSRSRGSRFQAHQAPAAAVPTGYRHDGLGN